MRVDSAVTLPETIEVLISQSRLQNHRALEILEAQTASCWQQILTLELAETVRMYRVHFVHVVSFCALIQHNTTTLLIHLTINK